MPAKKATAKRALFKEKIVAFKIEGVTPLRPEAMSSKVKGEFERVGQGIASGRAKERDPLMEACGKAYFHPTKAGFAYKASAIAAGMERVANDIDLKMTQIRGRYFVEGDIDRDWIYLRAPALKKADYTEYDLQYEEELANIHKWGGSMTDCWHGVKSATGKAPMLQYILELPKWSSNIKVTFVDNILSLAQITDLLARAGYCMGLGSGRPGKGSGRRYGSYKIA